jgi:hypothetical protein
MIRSLYKKGFASSSISKILHDKFVRSKLHGAKLTRRRISLEIRRAGTKQRKRVRKAALRNLRARYGYRPSEKARTAGKLLHFTPERDMQNAALRKIIEDEGS